MINITRVPNTIVFVHGLDASDINREDIVSVLQYSGHVNAEVITDDGSIKFILSYDVVEISEVFSLLLVLEQVGMETCTSINITSIQVDLEKIVVTLRSTI